MDFKKFRILPAAIALSMMMVPVAIAGAREDDSESKTEYEQPTPPDKTPNPTPPSPPSPPSPSSTGGGGNSHEYGSTSIVCRIGNRSVYVASFRQCKELKYALGYGQGGGGSVVVGGGYAHGGGTGYVYGGGSYATGGGNGYYQQQRIIRYVARPSRAAQMQSEKRSRRAAQAYVYGDGGMVGYGNGVMVGGYGNKVVINGNVYAGQQIIVKKKRKHKRNRRVVYQQPVYDNGYGYDYEGPVMYKGGGY